MVNAVKIVNFEPRGALVGGVHGTEVLHRLLHQAWTYLVPGGWLLLEVGKGQAEAVCRLAAETGRYTPPTVRKDPAGIDRVIRMQSLGH